MTETPPVGSPPGGAAEPPLVSVNGFAEDDAEQKVTSRRRWRLLLGITVTLLLVGGAYVGAYLYAGTTVPTDTTVLGIDIGGLTPAEAEEKLRDDLPAIADAEMTLLVQTDSYTIVPSESGLNIDVDATVRAAGVGTSDPVRLVRAIVNGGGPVDPVIAVDDAELTAAIDRVADTADRDPVEARIAFREGRVRARLPEDGRTVDRPSSVLAVADAYLVEVGPVTLPTDVVTSLVTDEEVDRALAEFAQPAMSGPVFVRSDAGSFDLTTAQLSTVLSMELDSDNVFQPTMDRAKLLEISQPELDQFGFPASNASVIISDGAPVVLASEPGRRADTSTYADDVFASLTKKGAQRTVRVPLMTEQAEFTTADARNSGVKQVVAEFTTYYPHADYRNINIGRAAELATNTFLRPDDVFSMNGVVGERTEARGFTKGFIINNGRFAEGVGGGVSQLATTLYNAGHFAGFSDIEHHPHSFYIDRYPVGREATVAWGFWDLQFGNNTPYGAVVEAFINPSRPGSQGAVTVRIWSTPYWQVNSVTGDRYNPTPYQRQRLSGEDCVPSEGADGFDIVVTRTLSLNGAAQEKENIYTRYLPTPEVTCTG